MPSVTVSFNYAGGDTLSADLSGCTPGNTYALAVDDGASSTDTQVAAASALTLTVTGINPPGGAGDFFDAQVFDGAAFSVGSDYLGATIVEFGTAGERGFDATWSFDGTSTLAVTFTGVAGQSYTMDLQDPVNGGQGGNGIVADGTEQTLTTNYGYSIQGDYFNALLFIDATNRPVTTRLFTAGVAGAGSAGNPTVGGGGGAATATACRVQIAFDDPMLERSPVWTRIDTLSSRLVAGVDIRRGRQTELDRTDTGTAVVYLNDTGGLFDPNNASSPYFGKLDGAQILIDLWNPVTEEWLPQFRGFVDYASFDISPATGPDGKPLTATIQLECVDLFDYLAGCEMIPGSFGDLPPTGSEGAIFYEDTAGTVDDRIIQLLTDAGVTSDWWVVFTGNVSVQETLYDPGDSVLTGLRDAADAEFPGIANQYCDKTGRYVFHGRYARITPEAVEATTTPDRWDFNRWKVGDGTAIQADATRAQVRMLAYTRGRRDIVNAAIAWPKGIAEADIPGQVYSDATSITQYGVHSLPPMQDLIVLEGTTTGNTAKAECLLFAQFYVENLKTPRVRVKTLTLKTVRPDDSRAAATWSVLCSADISDVMNVTVGYPGGTGLDGEDFYIEGVTQRIRPLVPGYAYVEADFDVSPAAWWTDDTGVFPPFS